MNDVTNIVKRVSIMSLLVIIASLIACMILIIIEKMLIITETRTELQISIGYQNISKYLISASLITSGISISFCKSLLIVLRKEKIFSAVVSSCLKLNV